MGTGPQNHDGRAEKSDPESSFGYGLVYNPIDPLNQYPHYETGEEVYGPPPLFGINKHDPLNMKPFNPNMYTGLLGSAPAVPGPMLAPTLGPNPFTPLLQPMTPQLPLAPHVPNPLLMAAAMSTFTDSSFAPGEGPSSSFSPGTGAGGSGSPDSSYMYTFYPSYPFDYVYPFATVMPQYQHPTDPNNQYPNPLTGSMTEPGPALAGGYNVYDPQNLIGAPPAFSERDRIIEHNRAAMQARSPHAPYIMHPLPVPPPDAPPAR